MRKLLPFLAYLMLALTGWSSMAHAAEATGGGWAEATFTVHAPGDADEMPADGDSGVPHHHNVCHGHDVGHPARAATPSLLVDATSRAFFPPARTLTAADQHVALRPPKA